MAVLRPFHPICFGPSTGLVTSKHSPNTWARLSARTAPRSPVVGLAESLPSDHLPEGLLTDTSLQSRSGCDSPAANGQLRQAAVDWWIQGSRPVRTLMTSYRVGLWNHSRTSGRSDRYLPYATCRHIEESFARRKPRSGVQRR
jgi:hypothetical protein